MRVCKSIAPANYGLVDAITADLTTGPACPASEPEAFEVEAGAPTSI